MIFKRVTLLAFFILVIGLLFACGTKDSDEVGSETGDTSPTSESITIDLASTLPYEEHKVLIDELEANLDEYSDGRISLELFMDGVLGGESEGMTQLSSGEVDMALGVLHSSLYYPEYDAPGVPYLFPDYESVFEYMDGPMGEKIDEILLDEANLIQVGYYTSGPRWATANKSLETAEDFKGLKLRLSENPLHVDVWSDLGAVPTPMPSPDVFSALQTGTIDAQENWISNILGRHLYEAQEYLIATDHILSFGTFLVNATWWNDLSSDDIDIIQRSIDDALEIANDKLEEEQERLVKELTEDHGMELIEPDVDILRNAAKNGIQQVIEDHLAPEVKEELKNMGIEI